MMLIELTLTALVTLVAKDPTSSRWGHEGRIRAGTIELLFRLKPASLGIFSARHLRTRH
jgi:hypothetical protein